MFCAGCGIRSGGRVARQPQTVESVIDGLYDAAVDAARWPSVLAAAAELFSSDGAEIGHFDLADSQLSFLITHGYHYTPQRIRQYEALMPEDPRLTRLAQRPFLPMHCRMIVSDEELHASRLYREVLAPDGVEYSLGVNLVEEQQSATFFVALRRPGKPCFDAADCTLLGRLVPDLRRVLRLYRHFADVDLSRIATLEALDQVPLGILVLRKDGTLIVANRTAQELASEGGGFSVRNGFLHVTDPASARRLRRAIEDVAARTGRPHAVTIHGSDHTPLRLLVACLPGERAGRSLALPWKDAVVVFVNDPHRAQAAPWEQLQHMFGLFPGEAKLLGLLVEGETIGEAAEKLGLTRNSARQYIKSVFAKTGTHRQSELVRKVMDSPVWINKHRRRH